MSALTHVHTPEERELARQQATLDRLSNPLPARDALFFEATVAYFRDKAGRP
jgi:hypothetical protein